MPVPPVPPAYHTLTPYLVVPSIAAELDFLVKGLGAVITERVRTDAGKDCHAEVRIGDSMVMLGEAMPGHPAQSSMLYVYVADCDALFAAAVRAGATAMGAPAPQFWGDRMGMVRDLSGNTWAIATHVEDVSPEELNRRASAARR